MRDHISVPDDHDIVLVPAHPSNDSPSQLAGDLSADVASRAERQVVLETRIAPPGMPCGMAFTSVERIVNCLTEHQPWIALPLGAARALYGDAGIRTVAVDPVASDDHVNNEVQK